LQLVLDTGAAIEELGRRYMGYKNFLYLGRGIIFPWRWKARSSSRKYHTSMRRHTQAGEMKHGPIALIDENMPVVVVSPMTRPARRPAAT